jgi:hypothetical protein
MKPYPWRLPSPDQSVLYDSESALVITHRNDHPRTESLKLAHDQNSSGREGPILYPHTPQLLKGVLISAMVNHHCPSSGLLSMYQISDTYYGLEGVDYTAKCQIHIRWLPKMLQGKPHGLPGNKTSCRSLTTAGSVPNPSGSQPPTTWRRHP